MHSPVLDETLNRLTERLLEWRTPDSRWEGELSSSALSTATAVLALLAAGTDSPDLVSRGLDWLVRRQNRDGGWGDTIASRSNISTSALCWAALTVAGRSSGQDSEALHRVQAWLEQAAGSLGPDEIASAVAAKYGGDRTFSAPILTALALAGRLGPQTECWRRVPQLPFELAAFPRQWFRWLRLPVVSYALPALIAIGQVRHARRPSGNIPARIARDLLRKRTLRILGQIQPASGGYLEAIPLTSFVVLSLAAVGRTNSAAAKRGIEFLVSSVREDGSWAIDTNLAIWVTTHAVNALSRMPHFSSILSETDRRKVLEWLLGQQYRVRHPYTNAAPGGWAWTDLPGGVPDADDTSGALLALHNLDREDLRVQEAACAGARWLLGLQNRDGGMPTFCRGWGKLPFDRSCPDLTAHSLEAWNAWRDRFPEALKEDVARGIDRAVQYLRSTQRCDGAWIPLWFGNETEQSEENPTYGTAGVVRSLCSLSSGRAGVTGMIVRGCEWLLSAQNRDGGWGGGRDCPSSIEETGLALSGLAAAGGRYAEVEAGIALQRGVQWLIERTDCGRSIEPAPIGLYFARLWYCEALYPVVFALSGLAAARSLLGDSSRAQGSSI